MSLTNPFLRHSTLPYQAPQFDQIEVQHYRPAFDEGVRQKRAEIEAIVQNPLAPDFANTLHIPHSTSVHSRILRCICL